MRFRSNFLDLNHNSTKNRLWKSVKNRYKNHFTRETQFNVPIRSKIPLLARHLIKSLSAYFVCLEKSENHLEWNFEGKTFFFVFRLEDTICNRMKIKITSKFEGQRILIEIEVKNNGEVKLNFSWVGNLNWLTSLRRPAGSFL